MSLRMTGSVESYLSAPILGLLILSPLLFIGILHDASALPRYAALALTVCLCGAGLTAVSWRQQMRIQLPPITAMVIFFFILAGISASWASAPGTNLVYLVQLGTLILLFFFCIQVASTKFIHYALYSSIFAAAIAAAIGILQNFGVDFPGLRGFAIPSTFYYKNHATLYLDLILPVSLVLALTNRHLLLRWLAALALTLCLSYVVDSYTRGSLVAMSVSMGALITACFLLPGLRRAIFTGVKHNRYPLLLAVTLSSIIIWLPGENDVVLDRPHYAGDKIDTSTRDRLTAWTNSLDLVAENPLFGSGYGSFWKAFRPYTNHPNIIQRSDMHLYFFRLHSDPLQMLVELGITGILLFTVIIAMVFYYSYRLLIDTKDPVTQTMVIAMLLGIIASLTHSLVDFPLLKPSSAIQLWLYIGLLAGLYARTDTRFSYPVDKSAAFPLGIGTLVLGFFLVHFYTSHLMESYYFRKSELAGEDRNCTTAIDAIDKAVDFFPHNFFSHRHRVGVHVSCNKDAQKLYQVLNQELLWDDTNTLALMVHGDLLLQSGYPDLARKDYEKIAYLLPHRAEGKLGVAKVHIFIGDYVSAHSGLSELQDSHPDNQTVNDLLKLVNTKLEAEKSGG